MNIWASRPRIDGQKQQCAVRWLMLECFFANICETFWPCTSDKRKQYKERKDEKEAAWEKARRHEGCKSLWKVFSVQLRWPQAMQPLVEENSLGRNPWRRGTILWRGGQFWIFQNNQPGLSSAIWTLNLCLKQFWVKKWEENGVEQ